MVKKNILILLFLITGISFSVGQTDKQQTTFHQLGLNIGPLWTNIIHHDSRLIRAGFSIFDNREVLSYKLRKGNTALRLGLGGKYREQKTEDNTDNKSTLSSFSGRLGLEKIIDLTEKWQCYYGADIKMAIGKIKEGFTEDPYKWNKIGLSSFLGIQYRLTPRLIFQTEASLQFSQTNTQNPIFFIDPIFVEPQLGSKTKINSIDIVLPNILYLAFEF